MSTKIGSLVLENRLILAPMAGVTDFPFRRICRRMGAGLVGTEMVSAQGLVIGAPNTKRLLASDGTDRPLCVQLFGSDPGLMAQAAQMCQDHGTDVVDINMGCPVPKVVRRGAGAALLKDPLAAAKIIKAVRRVLHIPLTVKMRSGWTAGQAVAVELACMAQDCGVDAVVIHPRARSQGYATPANWDLIRMVKDAISIPVIGNGDVLEPQNTLAMKTQTGCDGVMIGRGARGNPWIFHRSIALLRGDPLPPPPSHEEIRQVLHEHLEAIRAHYGQVRALHVAKAHMSKYTRGLPASARLREKVFRAKDIRALASLMASYLETLESHPGPEAKAPRGLIP